MCHILPKMVPSCSLFISTTYIKSEYWRLGAVFEISLILWRYPFLPKFQMVLEMPKTDIFKNWPKRFPGDVIRCLESKFDKKIPMASVPNCRKEIANRYGTSLHLNHLETVHLLWKVAHLLEKYLSKEYITDSLDWNSNRNISGPTTPMRKC